jgi:hypothetical protein
MFNVLNEIQKKYCPICHVGSASKMIGYKSSGTCLDYIYDNFKVPYSLAWEIYSNENYFHEMEEYVKKYNSKLNNKGYDFKTVLGQGVIGIKSEIPISSQKRNLKNNNQLNNFQAKKYRIPNGIISNFFSIQEELDLLDKSQLELNTQINSSSNLRNSFTRVYSNDEKEMCVKLFNPMSKPAYQYIINNWMNALVELLEYVKNN